MQRYRHATLSPVPFGEDMPSFKIPEWSSMGDGTNDFSPAKMSRHFMVLGETGSGKTYSGVLPIIKSAIDYGVDDEKLSPSMLVIDPKRELLGEIESYLGKENRDRIIHLSLEKDDFKIDFYEGVDPEIITGLYIVDSIKEIIPTGEQSTDEMYWEDSGKRLIRRLIDFDLYFYKRDKKPTFFEELRRIILENFTPDQEETEDDEKKDGVNKEQKADRTSEEETTSKILRKAGRRRPSRTFVSDEDRRRHALARFFEEYRWPDNYDNYFRNFNTIVSLTADYRGPMYEALELLAKDAGVPIEMYVEFSAFRHMGQTTYGAICSFAINFLEYLKLDEVAKHVQFCPYAKKRKTISLNDAISQGKIIVFSPGDESVSIGVFVARVIKSKVFQICFIRENKERPMFYVCDGISKVYFGGPI